MIWNIKSEDTTKKIEVQQIESDAWIVLEDNKQTYNGDGKGLEYKFGISDLSGITKTKLIEFFNPKIVEENRYQDKEKLEEGFSPDDYEDFDDMVGDFDKDFGKWFEDNGPNLDKLEKKYSKKEAMEALTDSMGDFTTSSSKWTKITDKMKPNEIEKMYVWTAEYYF